MARIIRVKINWTGFNGGPGYTNLHFEQIADEPITQAMVDQAKTKVETWLADWRSSMPYNCFTGVDNSVAELDEQYGTIQHFWTVTPLAPIAGTQSAAYPAGSGACVNLSTDGVWNNRRVRGRIFMVPLSVNAYANDGTLDDTKLAAFRTSTAALIADGTQARLVVFRRPTKVLGEPLPNGGAYDVTSYHINDKVAQLRSRRD